jgi:HPP family
MKSSEVVLDTLGEGVLLLVVAAIGWATHQPLVYASLGPTAYEQVARPNDKSSRPFNVVVGHLIGLASGFIAAAVCGAFDAPKVASAGFVPGVRVWAIALAVALTAAGTLLAKARQPAATATSLLVALGAMQTARDAGAIVAGIVLIAVLGEPVRRIRARQMQDGTVSTR